MLGCQLLEEELEYIYTTQHRLMRWEKWNWLVVAILLNAHEHGNCD